MADAKGVYLALSDVMLNTQSLRSCACLDGRLKNSLHRQSPFSFVCASDDLGFRLGLGFCFFA